MKRRIQFNALTLTDFMSYHQQKIPLHKQGLVLIEGDNKISNALDANGVGKSAVVDGLCWALFGKTARPKFGGDRLVNRFVKNPECEALLDFDVDAQSYGLLRRRPHFLQLIADDPDGNGHTLGENTIAEAKLTALLRFGYQTFQHAVVFSQSSFDRFTTANHDERLRVLDEIQGIDYRAALKESTTLLKKANNDFELLSSRTVQLRVDRDRLREECAALKAERAAFAKTNADALQDLLEQQQRAKVALHAARATLEGITARQQKLIRTEKERGEKQRALDALRTSLTPLLDTQRQLHERVQRNTILAKNLVTRWKELKAQKRCPTCRQPTRTATASSADRRQLDEWKRKNVEYRQQLFTTQQLVDKLSARIRKLDATLLVTVKKTATDIAVDAQSAASQVATLTERCGQLREQIDHARLAKWSGASLLASTEKELVSTTKLHAKLSERRARRQKLSAIADYWAYAFSPKGIRNLFADNVMGFLNERCVAHLKILAAGECDLQLSTQHQNKKGTVAERLSIHSTWEWGANELMGASAGQLRREDLALFLALQDLAEHYATRTLPLRIFDEVGQDIDPRGQEHLATWFRHEIKKHDTILVITHNPILKAALRPDQVWTVVLEQKGHSHIRFH